MKKLASIVFLLATLSASSDVDAIESQQISAAKAKQIIRAAESRLISQCGKRVLDCRDDANTIIYYSLFIPDYKKALRYLDATQSHSPQFESKQCQLVSHPIVKYQKYKHVEYWAAKYISAKNVNGSANKGILDYAFMCHVFETWHNTKSLMYTTPINGIPRSESEFVDLAKSDFGPKASEQYGQFLVEIVDPYFVAYRKFLAIDPKTHQADPAGIAKAVALSKNAEKAVKKAGYPEMFQLFMSEQTGYTERYLNNFTAVRARGD